jgi:hypothetical protein
MRKDVECAFGIMKGRFRILKTGIRLHSIESVDMIWMTCCALHNLLLEVDGLDHPWDGVCIPTSAWDGELGELEVEEVPMAMRRALSPASIREYDTSSFGTPRTLNTDEMIDTSAEVVENEGGACVMYVS